MPHPVYRNTNSAHVQPSSSEQSMKEKASTMSTAKKNKKEKADDSASIGLDKGKADDSASNGLDAIPEQDISNTYTKLTCNCWKG